MSLYPVVVGRLERKASSEFVARYLHALYTLSWHGAEAQVQTEQIWPSLYSVGTRLKFRPEHRFRYKLFLCFTPSLQAYGEFSTSKLSRDHSLPPSLQFTIHDPMI
jgi:hypothetical protein